MNVLECPQAQLPLNRAIPAQRAHRDSACLVLTGDLDQAHVTQTQARLEELLRRGVRTVEVDLQDVTFLDLSTLRVLLHADQVLRARGGRLRLVNPSGRVQRLLRITRTEHLAGVDTRASQGRSV